MIICTNNSLETIALGQAIGELLRSGDVVALFGELGSGKTTLAKGIARGVGVTAEVYSPTFTIIHEHSGRVPFYHLDLYRMSGQEDAEMIGIEEYLYGEGIVVIEWAERAKALLLAHRIDINLKFLDDDKREITIGATSDRLREIMKSVVADAPTCD